MLPLGEYKIVPLSVTAGRNLCNIMAGTDSVNLPVDIKCNTDKLRSYAFSLPDGDKLLALWTDGVAVEDDPGIEATVTFSDFSAEKVTGIDVLNSFEQELVTSTEDGRLVIRELQVKDYPIILRLSG